MKHILPLIFLAPLMAVPSIAAEPQIGSGETEEYHLVWQDLFDAEELDPQRWDIEVNGAGGGNNELQYYTDRKENVRLGDDGQGNHCLILTARREEYLNKHFTSGRITSKNRTLFTHGKIEASIKLPKTANGLWPAFWMMGNDYDEVGWPRCGETDILEMGNADGIRANTQERLFNGAAHWGPRWPQASHAQASTKSYSLQDGEFHLYTLIWDENRMRMYVDLDKYPNQNPYYELKCPIDDPENEWSAGNYFHKDNFILFNLAVGGDFTGIHDQNAITALNEGNGNEASYYVNYVKIYQRGHENENLDALTKGDVQPDSPSMIEEFMAEESDTIHFDGREICSDTGCIRLYSADGQCIAGTDLGCLSTRGVLPGVYVASDGNSTCKIMIAKR